MTCVEDLRIYPVTNKNITKLTFQSRRNILDFFKFGDEQFKPPHEWKWKNNNNMDAADFRNFKQHYQGLCLTYIYALKCIDDTALFECNKKLRNDIATQWTRDNKVEFPDMFITDIALALYAHQHDM
jgi:hypothetical protein